VVSFIRTIHGRHRGLAALAAAGALGAASLTTANARAEPAACIASHRSGQRAKLEGHLRNAAKLFATCSADASCPAVVRDDCSKFLEETNRALPTVIFAVVEDDARDLTDVKVFADDELIASSLNGRAVELDPGPHHFRFAMPQGQVVKQDALVREGEKDRLIRVKVTSPRPAAPAPAAPGPAVPVPAAPPPARPHSPPLGAWIAASGAVAALATGVTLGALGAGKQSELDRCKPACPPTVRSTYDSAKSLYLGADISFSVAVVATGIATWLFLAQPGTRDRTADTSSPRRVSVGAAPTPGGASVVVRSVF